MPHLMTFKPFSTYVNGTKLGCAVRAKLTLNPAGQGPDKLEVEQYVPAEVAGEYNEQQLRTIELIRECFRDGEKLGIICGPIGQSLAHIKDATVIECRFDSETDEEKKARVMVASDGVVGTTEVAIPRAAIKSVAYATDEVKGLTRMFATFEGTAEFSR